MDTATLERETPPMRRGAFRRPTRPPVSAYRFSFPFARSGGRLLPRSLPRLCACCGEPAAEVREQSATCTQRRALLSRSFVKHEALVPVPYCLTCSTHLEVRERVAEKVGRRARIAGGAAGLAATVAVCQLASGLSGLLALAPIAAGGLAALVAVAVVNGLARWSERRAPRLPATATCTAALRVVLRAKGPFEKDAVFLDLVTANQRFARTCRHLYRCDADRVRVPGVILRTARGDGELIPRG